MPLCVQTQAILPINPKSGELRTLILLIHPHTDIEKNIDRF